MTSAVAWCGRCRKAAPVDEAELTGGAPDGDGVNMPTMVVPPVGWIPDPDADGIVCGDCATPDEITGAMAALDAVDAERAAMGDPEA